MNSSFMVCVLVSAARKVDCGDSKSQIMIFRWLSPCSAFFCPDNKESFECDKALAVMFVKVSWYRESAIIW